MTGERGPSYDPPELGLHLFTNAMRWAIATQPMNESTDDLFVLTVQLNRACDVQSPDGTAIELVFDHVTSRIEAVDSTAHPFRVEDTAGAVPVAKVSYPGGAAVNVELQRPIQGAAWITAAFGPHPPPVPFDVVRFMPILAFHRFPVA